MQLLAVLCVVGLVYMFYQGVVGLQTGIIQARGGPYSRGQDPVGFWISVVTFLGAPPIFLIVVLFKIFFPKH